jgi:hypothetical protein
LAFGCVAAYTYSWSPEGMLVVGSPISEPLAYRATHGTRRADPGRETVPAGPGDTG